MKTKVAVLGPAGTFASEAAKKAFPDLEIEYHDTIGEVFDAVAKGTRYGVVPIENSIEGSVNSTMDNLMEHDLKIAREVILDINLCLLAFPEAASVGIKIIMSHPHAIAQSGRFLKENYPKASLKRYESTTAAVKELKELDMNDIAAIAPKDAAGIYGLTVLRENIQDAPSQTRFIVISKVEQAAVKGSRTSIIFILKDRPGALYHALREFADHDINLKKIESRPSKKKLGDYAFYVDFEGDSRDKNVKAALEGLKEKTTLLKILGSY